MEVSIPFERMDMNNAQVTDATELWSGDAVDWKVPVKIPPKDVKLIKLDFHL
jgi:hypothetical protein